MVPETSLRAFIYCRVSTREQSTDDHYSLGNQEQRCRDYLKMKQWHLLSLRKDVASGKNDDRDGFQQMKADIEAKRVDVVVVYRLDRLSRNVRDIYDFLDRIKAAGIAFVSVTEGFDTTTAMGRAMLGVAAVFAQLTREMISENTRDGLLRRIEAGYSPGAFLYGYTYSKERGHHVICEEEAQIVRQIFHWYAEDKWGTIKIARMLNLRGIKTRTDTEWRGTRIGELLKNLAYAGQVDANGQILVARHEAIISPELFERTQQVRRGKAILPPRTQDSPHLLSGIATCGHCGRRLAVHFNRSAPTKSAPQGAHYRNYGHKHNELVGKGACKGMWKSAERLESLVISHVAAAAASGEVERVVLDDVRARHQVDSAPAVKERDKLLVELSGIGEKFSQWADRLDSGRIDEDQFALQNRRLLDRKQVLQARLDNIESELAQQESIDISFAEVRQALNNFPNVWSHLELEERREVLRLLIERLKVYRTHVELKLLFHDATEIPLAFPRGRPKNAAGTPVSVINHA